MTAGQREATLDKEKREVTATGIVAVVYIQVAEMVVLLLETKHARIMDISARA